jgi:hypothetical protein
MITLPGAFLDHKKGFEYYAKHIAMLVENKVNGIDSNNICSTCGTEFPAPPVQTNPPADEIILICHSMGGVAARLYLSDPAIGNPIAKAKIKKLITLASPHHGTDVLLEEIVSGLLAGLGPLIIPTIAAFIPGFATGLAPVAAPFASLSSKIYPIAISAASKGKCYKEIQRNTTFIKRLNYELSFPEEVDFYSIWTNGDKISTPIHTAVVDQAKNYYIDDLRVYHMNIVKNWRGLEAVADIIKGSFKECGLQSYPSESGCSKGAHKWQPIRTPLAYKREYLWSCENKSGTRTCDCQQIQRLKPPLLGSDKEGCAIGKRDKDRYMHTWRKTDLKKYECKKCKRACEVYSKPKAAAGTKKCDLPFRNLHRWRLKTREWQCKEC